MPLWLIAIDDTDDIGTKGTGEITEEIATKLSDSDLGIISPVTRHQLYVHPDIPYTSHNSAMCFSLNGAASLEAIRAIAIAHLMKESALVADPGLAVINCTNLATTDVSRLVKFGQETKIEVKTKSQAYELARMCGVSLTEHGGTGQGVIGALAGIGLRLSGNDGRVKGQVKLGNHEPSALALSGISVAQLITETQLDAVIDLDGEALSMEEVVLLEGKVKAVFLRNQFVLPVTKDGEYWRNAGKQVLKGY